MIKSQLEIIEQAKQYLNSVSNKDFTDIISPNFMSSAGSHMRHIIDHYLALMSGLKNDLIDYDVRVRGSEIESSPQLAMEKLEEIAFWIKSLSADELNKTITLSTEVSVINKNVQQVKTSVVRELVFVGSHAVHHYAMIALITFAQQSLSQQKLLQENNVQKSTKKTDSLPQGFGLAPATATFLRKNDEQPTESESIPEQDSVVSGANH